MLLVGNINYENLSFDSEGMLGETEVSFILPRRLARRSILKLKYFGYHAGLSKDNDDFGGVTFDVDSSDTGDQIQYLWRGVVKEIQMRVFTGDKNIMGDNVGTHYIDDVDETIFNSVENVDFISFPISKEIVSAFTFFGNILDNNAEFPLNVGRGHSQFYNTGLGHVEESTSKITVALSALPVVMTASTTVHSFEPNVKMDTISFILELN